MSVSCLLGEMSRLRAFRVYLGLLLYGEALVVNLHLTTLYI